MVLVYAVLGLRLRKELDVTPEEYRKRYKVRKRDLDNALQNHRVRGARQNSLGEWVIPEDAKIEFYPRRKELTWTGVMAYILKALSTFRYIDANIVGISETDYRNIVQQLIDVGLVKEVGKCDGVTTTGLALTMEGSAHAVSGMRELEAFVEKVARGVSYGATKAMLEGHPQT